MKTFKQYLKEQEDYKIQHRAPGPDGGAPLHDLTGKGEVYPDDVYSKNQRQYYGTGDDKMDKKTFDVINKSKGKPESIVEIHRAVPKHVKEINKGDWVTVNKDYAKEHGDAHLDGDYHIISKKVPAKHVYTNADSIHEFGFHPA